MEKLPKSVRKHIRFEKARIRREFSNKEEQEKIFSELYKNFEKNEKLFVKKSKKREAGLSDTK